MKLNSYIIISMTFILLIIPITSSQLPPTKSNFFTKLISNNADITGGESIFEINTPYELTPQELSFNFDKITGSLSSYQIYINFSNSREIPIYESNLILKPCINKTGDCSYTEIKPTGTKKVYFEDFKLFKSIVPAGSYKIKLIGKWKANQKINIDWIPKVSFSSDKTGTTNIEVIKDDWAWWNTNWGKKKLITITELTGIALTNYSVKLNITYNESMKADFSDLRFINSSENEALGYYIENVYPSSSAIIWVKIPSLAGGTTTQIYMYYNNSVATTSNISNAFLFGTNTFAETFTNATFSFDAWTDCPTMVKTTVNGVRNYTMFGDCPIVDSGNGDLLTMNFTGATISEADRLSFIGTADRLQGLIGVYSVGQRFTFGAGGIANPNKPNNFSFFSKDLGDGLGSQSNESIGNDSYFNQKFRLNVNATDIVFYANETLIKNYSAGIVKNYTYGLGMTTRATSNTGNVRFANWTVRNWAKIEPTYTFGTEQANLITENSQTYNATTVEGNTESFIINLTALNLSITSAYLFYNNTAYSGSIYSYGGGNYVMAKTLYIPNIDATVNYPFYWNITFNDTSYYTSSTLNQTVYNLTIDNCTINTVVLMNLTLKDEATQIVPSEFNSSIEVDINVYPIGSTISVINYSHMYSNVSYAKVCIADINNSNYKMDAIIRYVYEGHEPEFYNIQKMDLNKNNLGQNITLYDLLTTDSTQFLITYKDKTFVPVSDAIINIQRKYVSEGVFKTVEIPKTDTYGQATGHFDVDGVLYNIIVSKNGVVLGTFTNVAVICNDKLIGDCKINLNPNIDTGTFTNFQQRDNLIYTLSFNETTRTISSAFSTVDGSSAAMLLNAIKFDNYGNTTLCSDSLTGSSGNLACVIPSSYGNVTMLATLYKNGALITQETYTIYPNQEDTFGNDGYILVILLVITIPLMFITSVAWTAIGIIIGVGVAGMLLLFKSGSFLGTGSAIIWLIIAVGIILWKINKRGEGI